jgi:hypothetical protein
VNLDAFDCHAQSLQSGILLIHTNVIQGHTTDRDRTTGQSDGL